MTVYGGLTYVSGATTDPFNFAMYGGTFTINSGSSGTGRELFKINDVSSSAFYMSGGSMILQSPNGNGNGTVDFAVCGSNGTITSAGGTIQFGNSSTGSGNTFSFTPFANVVLPNFWITGPSGNSITLAPFKASTSDFELLSLKIDNGKIFDVRSNGGANGDTKNMTLTFTPDDIYGFYNNGTFTAMHVAQSLSTAQLRNLLVAQPQLHFIN